MNIHRTRIVLPGVVILLAAASLFLAGCRGGSDFRALRRGQDFNVILVTLDTIRADRLACYGCDRVRTPAIDGFARRGLRFERCLSQTPLTLPSHTTIMSGTFPPFHGVRDNGGALVPAGLETLATVFKSHGYQTAAFVAAYVLDSRWGLNRGFDLYFDQFDLNKPVSGSILDVQRPANEVVDAALPWLERAKSGKFFAWIHLYDPHAPYAPPAPYDKEYAAEPYLGEIAFADSQIARVWDFLEKNGLDRRTFLVFCGDHGESLGAHQEATHGFFIYQESLRVPLIVVTPFPKLQGRVSSRVARLADIMPTVMDMCGWPAPASVQGASLAGEFAAPGKAPAELAYSESYYPRFHFGWSELRSVQDARYKLIVAPTLELYDLAQDPGEATNIAGSKPEVARSLRAQAEDLFARYGRNALHAEKGATDQATRERLASLGYLGSSVDTSRLEGRTLADPKDKIGLYNQLAEAQVNGSSGREDEAVAELLKVVAQEPAIVDAHFALGTIYLQARRLEEAVAEFGKVLALNPSDTYTALNIAVCYSELDQPDKAERFVLDYLEKGVRDPELYLFLTQLNLNHGKLEEAARYADQALAVSPGSAAAHNILGAISLVKGDLDQAESHAREAVQLNPRLSTAHYNLAQVLKKKGLTDQAEAEYKAELEVTPAHFKSALNLSLIYRERGQEAEELDYLEKAIRQAPPTVINELSLAQFCLERGVKLEEAVALAQKAIDLKPEGRELAAAYALLSELYRRLGDPGRAAEYARLANSVRR